MSSESDGMSSLIYIKMPPPFPERSNLYGLENPPICIFPAFYGESQSKRAIADADVKCWLHFFLTWLRTHCMDVFHYLAVRLHHVSLSEAVSDEPGMSRRSKKGSIYNDFQQNKCPNWYPSSTVPSTRVGEDIKSMRCGATTNTR